MMAKTGLLILTNPLHIGKILPTIKKQVKKTLYIHLTNALNEPSYKPEIFSSLPKYSKTIRGIYSEAAIHCDHLDVRVLISNLRQQPNNCLVNTSRSIDLVIFDKLHEKPLIDKFLNTCVGNKHANCSILILENNETTSNSSSSDNIERNSDKMYKHVVLGGTFDRLHTGHKILLTEAILNASEKLTVGVTDVNMLNSKILWELVEPIEARLDGVRNFLTDVCPSLNYNIVPIQDPFGPTQSDPTMNMIVVSAETIRGGEKVNELREKNGLQLLDIISVDLMDCHDRLSEEEEKISSSTNRRRLLGTLLKPPKLDSNDKIDGPYVIGLTGGIASGKSAVSQRLQKLGATIVDCDKVAHELYQKGKPCHKLIHEAWGDKVLDEKGEINRKVLGGIVFGDKNELQRLNSLVWPAIALEVQNRIKELHSEGNKVIVIEAAVLVTAGWEKLCNEVWACIIPVDEAVKRLQNRNNLKEVEAKQRISSQPQNIQHVQNAHVILCTFWSFEYTQYVVEKAWTLLQNRLPNTCKDNKL